MDILRGALRREARLKLGTSIVLMSCGLLLCIGFFSISIILTIFGLVLLVLGINWLFDALRSWRIEEHNLFRLLRHQPRQIVWVYSIVTQRMPFGFQFTRDGIMYFKLINGEEISVSMPAKKCKLVSHTLNRLLPHASFGYTRDREQWYIANPKMLIKDFE